MEYEVHHFLNARNRVGKKLYEESRMLRALLTAHVTKWERPTVSDYEDDSQKRWVRWGVPLFDRQLFFGIPGKDVKKYPNDMRPRVWLRNESYESGHKPQTEMLTFKEIIEPLAQIMKEIDHSDRVEIFHSLIKMYRPVNGYSYKNIDGKLSWYPDNYHRLLDIHQSTEGVADITLGDALLLLEGIAINEDARYMEKKPSDRGRPNNVGAITNALMRYLQLGENIETKSVAELWNDYVKRLPPENIRRVDALRWAKKIEIPPCLEELFGYLFSLGYDAMWVNEYVIWDENKLVLDPEELSENLCQCLCFNGGDLYIVREGGLVGEPCRLPSDILEKVMEFHSKW